VLAHSQTTLVWNIEPLQLLPTLVVAFLYAKRAHTLSRRGTPVPVWRQVAFWTGIALVLVALMSPIDELGEEDLFFFHMLQHVILGDLAPLCFVVGLTGPMLRPVLALPGFDRLRVLAHPLVALPVWAINLYMWHVPWLYQTALEHSSVHALEHFMFFACGAIMWSPVVETLPAPAWFGTGAKLGYIFAVRLIEAVLGNIFMWTSTTFYPWYEHAEPTWGISAVRDQNLAGVVMMAEGSIITLAVLAWLFLRLGAEGELKQRLIEEGYDPKQVARAVRYGRAGDLTRPH